MDHSNRNRSIYNDIYSPFYMYRNHRIPSGMLGAIRNLVDRNFDCDSFQSFVQKESLIEMIYLYLPSSSKPSQKDIEHHVDKLICFFLKHGWGKVDRPTPACPYVKIFDFNDSVLTN